MSFLQATELKRRREQLIARSDSQRVEIVQRLQMFDGPLKMVDRVHAGLLQVRRYPALLALPMVILFLVRRRNVWGWLRGGFALWRTYRTLRGGRPAA